MPLTPPLRRPARVVVLVSGTGTNLQALIDASEDPSYGVTVAALCVGWPARLAPWQAVVADGAPFPPPVP